MPLSLSPDKTRRITWSITLVLALAMVGYHGLWLTILPDELWFHTLAADTLAAKGPLAVFTTPNHLAYGTFFWAVLIAIQWVVGLVGLSDYSLIAAERMFFALCYCSPLVYLQWRYGNNLRNYALALAFYFSTTMPLWFGKIISPDVLLVLVACLYMWQATLFHSRKTGKYLWWALALLGLATGIKLYCVLLGLLLLHAPTEVTLTGLWHWLRSHLRREWYLGIPCFIGALMVGNTALWAGTANTSLLSSSAFDVAEETERPFFDGRHFHWAFDHPLVPFNDGAFTTGMFDGLIAPVALFILLYYHRQWFTALVSGLMLLLAAFSFCFARDYMTWYWYPFVMALLTYLPVHRPWLLALAVAVNVLSFHAVFDFDLRQKDLLWRDQRDVVAATAEAREQVLQRMPADSVTFISTYSYLWSYQNGDKLNDQKNYVLIPIAYKLWNTPYVAHICSNRHFELGTERNKFLHQPNYMIEGRDSHQLDTTLSVTRGKVFLWRRR